MRKPLFLFLFFMAMTGFRYAYGQDNLLAVDIIDNKQRVLTREDNPLTKDENSGKAEVPAEEVKAPDDSDGGLERIKAYREVLESKQKELEVIRLDLEKSGLLLKKRQAEKEIFEIDQALPQGKAEVSSIPGSFTQGAKEPLADILDIKIQLLVIADNLKEGQISLKGSPYSFKEGDSIASKLTVEQIEPSGVTFKQTDGSTFKLNFIN